MSPVIESCRFLYSRIFSSVAARKGSVAIASSLIFRLLALCCVMHGDFGNESVLVTTKARLAFGRPSGLSQFCRYFANCGRSMYLKTVTSVSMTA
ncbi:hypothetical protein AVEN_204874-1 [Araneus ventricosus]|uniref:Uncharacterized protein n=1 Tax=Araneus ventricosus TaxID=182803 RepID=A0A4Y2TM26_ARAVE|nr:hypothetical protein AVEN_204874-1 [Araneus ventricosus]